MATLYPIIVVFVGGGIGSVLRWLISIKLNPMNHMLTLGTLGANLLGALIIGAAIAWIESADQLSATHRLFWITGLCGGLTTFSTFSLEVFQRLQQQNWLSAGFMIMMNVVISIGFVALSYHFIKLLSVK